MTEEYSAIVLDYKGNIWNRTREFPIRKVKEENFKRYAEMKTAEIFTDLKEDAVQSPDKLAMGVFVGFVFFFQSGTMPVLDVKGNNDMKQYHDTAYARYEIRASVEIRQDASCIEKQKTEEEQ